MSRRTVGILVFEGVEVLDFAGPFEVFSRTRLEPGHASRRSEDTAPFRVLTVAPTHPRGGAVLRATGGLAIVPDHGTDDAPELDVLVVPGGFGTRALLEDEAVLAWLDARAEAAELVTSVCTGALLLARIGRLAGRRATTHAGSLDALAALDPTIDVRRGARVVDDGIVSSAGVAAGIDLAFDVVEKLCGRDVADETAAYIEYPRGRAS